MKIKKIQRAELKAKATGMINQPVALIKEFSGPVVCDEQARTATFIYSDGSVDRYNDTINPKGWELDNYRANPIALYIHDAGSVENVIGRSIAVEMKDGALIGTIEFMAADLNPKADTVFRMVQAGFLKCVSVGFRPLEYRAATDKNRKGGIDFIKQELLEISVVPVPALPSAVVQEKGFDLGTLRGLGVKVEEDGIGSWEKNETKEAPGFKVKSLYHISWLASLLADIGYLEDCIEWEQGVDGPTVLALVDAMKLLGQALVELTQAEVQALLDAEAEEVATGVDSDSEMSGMELSAPSSLRQALTFLRSARKDPYAATLLLKTFGHHLDGEKISISRKAKEPIQLAQSKSGRILSKENQATLQAAYDSHIAACEKLKSVLDKVMEEPEDTVADNQTCSVSEDAEKEIRIRKARAAAAMLALKD